MSYVIIGLVLGVVVGFAAGWGVRTGRAKDEMLELATAEASSRAQAQAAHEALERAGESERTLEALFEATAGRLLGAATTSLATSQAEALRTGSERLDVILRPLESALVEYKRGLVDLERNTTGALSEVRGRAEELLAAQVRTSEETRRLNTLLGRGDRRGRWGEVQLANVLSASGLRGGVDYELQVSARDTTGQLKRPDAVVRLGGAGLALDAKFPYDAFEAADALEGTARKAKLVEHAAALKSHVRALGEKSYWDVVDPSPEFVVCFVPSDGALEAALEADGELANFAASRRVLLVGPTNLMALLWSVAMVVRQFEAVGNAREILEASDTLIERVRNVADPIVKLGTALDAAVEAYNRTVRSVESRLLPVARRISALGRGRGEIAELVDLETRPIVARDDWGPGLFGDEA